MWRNNVLRVRNCSSATVTRHGGYRWYSSEGSLSISAPEFDKALLRVFEGKQWVAGRSRIGFAVSGGVDSMALAALYKEARETNGSLPIPHGFIVDHKVRPESTEEAEWVAEQLRSRFRMEAAVLSLTWSDGLDRADTRRFETAARTLRYQALGRACREKKINMLMVAHHGDDQAETVMMRLANNRLRSGLQAIHSVDWIPECEGIYGVYHSGKKQRLDPNLNIPFPVEQGGIQLLRPLLAFEKSRLIATCEEKGVVWAEDKTNQIQTLTSRNAIRHIHRNHKLPAALSIKSLVNVSLKMQKRVESHKAYAQKLFDSCLIKLDIQTGCLLVRFPPVSSLLARPIATESDKTEAKDNAYCLIERVAELVSPKPKVHLGQLSGMIQSIYPELVAPEDSAYSTAGMEHFAKIRCVHGVWWRSWDNPSPFEDPEESFEGAGAHPKEWLLTRQPLDRLERNKLSNHMIFPPTAPGNSRPRDTYELFDGRFWIRLRNYSKDTLTLRLFEKTDFRHLPTTQQDRQNYLDEVTPGMRPHRFISAAFALLKPSDLRFSLPAVFRTDSKTGEETLIGFPTLDVRMGGFGPLEGVCEWSVRYKKIDFGKRSAGDIIVPGSSRMHIIAEEKRQKLQHKGIARLKLRERQGLGEGVEDDRFTGYKRGSDLSEEEKEERRNEAIRKLLDAPVRDGENADVLSFLVNESAKEGLQGGGRGRR